MVQVPKYSFVCDGHILDHTAPEALGSLVAPHADIGVTGHETLEESR